MAIVDVGAGVHDRDKEAVSTLLGSALAVPLFFGLPVIGRIPRRVPAVSGYFALDHTRDGETPEPRVTGQPIESITASVSRAANAA